ncbi:MAG: tRNA (guanosine(37)-N1)-methyltransferase TrmD [Coriobacteriia bacterium]|nr:tRNA (guanosine(37)-N1)-methyltransferase TrmD [Coriobacteriia bacterium]
MRIDVISIFPQMFDEPMSLSIIGRARTSGILDFQAHDLRNWTHDRHRTTDDEPYGGGQGLLMKVEPVFEALDALLAKEDGAQEPEKETKRPLVICFSPHGKPFNQELAAEFATYEQLILICGRYEGLDERVYERVDRIISVGDFILTGGELPAMLLTDAVCRLLPGALGDEMSNLDESFINGLLEYPQYTRPSVYRGLAVPDVLLSGDHANISAWRRNMSIMRTAQYRPDLLETAVLSEEERLLATSLLRDVAI